MAGFTAQLKIEREIDPMNTLLTLMVFSGAMLAAAFAIDSCTC